MNPTTWAQVITLILTEAPQLVGFIQQLQANGQVTTNAQDLAAMGVEDAAFEAAYNRLFPTA